MKKKSKILTVLAMNSDDVYKAISIEDAKKQICEKFDGDEECFDVRDSDNKHVQYLHINCGRWE